MGDYGRDKLLAEIVAFANTHGGHLIIGIEESSDKPKRAIRILPVPQCCDLADRITQAAFACVQPRLSGLQVKGVIFDDQGGGVVVCRVPQSRDGPHRLESTQSEFARHCYVRRGENTEHLSMREIQDLTLNSLRGDVGVTHKLEQFKKQFELKTIRQPLNNLNAAVAIRCSAVPLQDVYLLRPEMDVVLSHVRHQFTVSYAASSSESLLIPVKSTSTRVVLRGALAYTGSGGKSYEHFIGQDGTQSAYYAERRPIPGREHPFGVYSIYMGWMLGLMSSVLFAAKELATIGENPAVEFGVALQVVSTEPATIVFNPEGAWRGVLADNNFQYPVYSFLPELGVAPVLDHALADILNSTGHEHKNPIVDVK